MAVLQSVAEGLVAVAGDNRGWMTWNLFLAFVPVVLALLIFRHRGERNEWWWAGLALFVLFLPNAPYVITDLVHLRGDVVSADGDAAVVGAVLPTYAVFIGAGLLAYTFSLSELGRYLERTGWAQRRPAIEIGVHALAAIGVVLGRFARLNSWEPVTEPRGTFEQVLLVLSARWAVVAVVVMFVVIWATHAATRAVAQTAIATASRTGARLQRMIFGP